MNTPENLLPAEEDMSMQEAASYMEMEEQALRHLLIQLGYAEAANPSCQHVPCQYVEQLEAVKTSVDDAVKPPSPPKQLMGGEEDSSASSASSTTALTQETTTTIAKAHNVSIQVVEGLFDAFYTANVSEGLIEGELAAKDRLAARDWAFSQVLKGNLGEVEAAKERIQKLLGTDRLTPFLNKQGVAQNPLEGMPQQHTAFLGELDALVEEAHSITR